MTKTWTNKRVEIREGWYEAGRQGIAVGEPVLIEQDWVPVKMDDEEDPTFHKKAGLVFAPDKPYDAWDEVRARTFHFDDEDVVRALLSDADALLEVARAIRTIEPKHGNPANNSCPLCEALAALPGHLK